LAIEITKETLNIPFVVYIIITFLQFGQKSNTKKPPNALSEAAFDPQLRPTPQSLYVVLSTSNPSRLEG